MNFWVPWKLGNTWSSWVAISMSKRLFYGVTVFRSEVSPQPSLSYGFYVYSRPFTKFIIIHHVPERLGMFPVPWSSRWNWSLHLFLGHPMFLCPFGLYCSACFGSLFVSILWTCCRHFKPSSPSSSSCSWSVMRVSCSLILKMKLVPPSLPRSSYVPSPFWFILQCLFW